MKRIEQQEQELIDKLKSSTIEDSSQVFKEYAAGKSRHNKKKLKRLNDKKQKKWRKTKNKPETETSTNDSPAPCSIIDTTDTNETEEKQETVKKSSKKSKKSNDEQESRRVRSKSRKTKLSIEKLDKRSKREKKKKLKKLEKDIRVPDSREEFLKKLAVEELPISFTSVKKKKNRRNSDLDSLHSYRCNDDGTQSDNDNVVEQNISSQLSAKLSQIKKKKQKVVVEDLTEFQLEHLRNAQVPYVEVKQCSRRQQRKNEAKFNNLADKLVDKMNIL